ncbi:hypothetical protein ACFL47_01540 [Candidatus Latescibacterota bacterium]
MKKQKSRRSFFGKAAAAATAGSTLAASTFANTQSKRKTSSVELIQVGAACLSDNSHMNYRIWAPMINQTDPERWPMGRTTRMRITHCWDRDYSVAQKFAEQYKCEAVKHYYDMVDKVDGMIFAGFNEVKWWKQLSKPYLEAGIPCYLNRPFAYSMNDAKDIVDRSKKYKTPILCTDEREFIQQTNIGRKKISEMLKNGFTITGANGDNSAGNEYPQHGVHGLYFMLAILGLDVAKASLQADGWWREVTKSAKKAQTWAQITLQYRGIKMEGVGEQTKPFVASQHQSGSAGDASMRVYHSGPFRGYWDVEHPWTTGWERMFYLFFPTVLAMQRLFETRTMDWDHDYILKKTRIFLTAFKSHLEHNGAMLDVDSLPDEWEAPCPYPDWLDESIFL